MIAHVLIDALVRQSMVMVARLATTGGIRSPLAHLADQVFGDVTAALRTQGVKHAVIADMFGLGLRTYHAKVKRLDLATTSSSKTIWQAVVDYVLEQKIVTRGALLQRFRQEDPLAVLGIVNDLTRSGWLYRKGEETQTVYRVAEGEDLIKTAPDEAEGLQSLVWILVRQHGPISKDELATKLPSVAASTLEDALDKLVSRGNIDQQGSALTSKNFLITEGEEAKWAGAVVHHYQAVINTICARAESGSEGRCHGSTYKYEVWEEHPLASELTELIAEMRRRASDLRRRIDDYNRTQNKEVTRKLTLYTGHYEERNGEM